MNRIRVLRLWPLLIATALLLAGCQLSPAMPSVATHPNKRRSRDSVIPVLVAHLPKHTFSALGGNLLGIAWSK
jgi:hypothetical protein